MLRPRLTTLPSSLQVFLRMVWVVLQVVAALWMARSGLDFYYQGF